MVIIMEYILPLLIILLAILVCVLLVVLVRSNDDKSENCSVYGWGGIDLSDGLRSGEEIHGFRGLKDATRVKSGNLKAVVYLEEGMTRNQFRAELGSQVIIGRLIQGQTNINDLSVSSSVYLSRHHCRLIEYNGLIYVENLSRTGTVVNGIEISQPMPLRQGDIMLLGDVQLRVLAIEVYRR
ncbi:MAG: FHA domain-containing protein [Oscillospiraceae bacterium]|nr:FHA domain-containing protein [Oscillospiraceae bacterium]